MVVKFKEFKRFEKQIILKKVGIAGQEKIKKAKVLVWNKNLILKWEIYVK